ncbi:uncharacterized protein CLUP02_08204 [Colletotrichum lupini]|uniref:Uncharacterized protein n=1 Tax=Colletotrichum lupini TaxID=145971 RepID=A0A9Q8SSG0_9PEZI|nr:uncharacterized protein CLUP02_08204 [Colletotrichum lupini]UQC82714.1 hypothetical protein CLUP02_08204 [Colletotrichum lupini]
MVKGERYGTGPESGAGPGRKWKEQEPSTDTTKLQQSEVQNSVVPEERAMGSFNGEMNSNLNFEGRRDGNKSKNLSSGIHLRQAGQALTVVITLFCSKIGSGGRRKRRGKEGSTAPAAGGRGSLPSFPISKALSITITDMAFSIVDASCQPRALSNNPPTSLFPSPPLISHSPSSIATMMNPQCHGPPGPPAQHHHDTLLSTSSPTPYLGRSPGTQAAMRARSPTGFSSA